MTRHDLVEWVQAALFVATIIAIPWIIGYLALAMGAMG